MTRAERDCNVSFQQALDEAIGYNVSSPYHQSVQFCFKLVVITFAVSTVTRNYSQVDKLWSILPAFYAWMAVTDIRTLLMALLATIWSIRLTYNFARRGGYKWPPWDGDQDYRWEYIQKGEFLPILKEPIAWILFNFGFISLFQNILLLWIAAPSLVAYTVAKECPSLSPLNLLDGLATVLYLIFVYIETTADNQQYQFQTEKYRLKNLDQPLAGEYADGFCQSGLFAIVRKPNYAAEQAIWLSFYVFSVAATGRVWNWSAVGILLLMSLFQGSGWLTECLSRKKYGMYSVYRKQVPLYVPNLMKLLSGKNPVKKNV